MPATWTATTQLGDQPSAEALGAAMEEMEPEPMGVAYYEVEDDSGIWEVAGYFKTAPDSVELALLAASFGAPPFVVGPVPDTDWVEKVRRELTPVEAGRFFVYGSHDADKVPADSVPLLIEAAMAFGTGHHGTTLGCLNALDRLAREGFVGHRVADIGCGTAVLAMAAARVWSDTVIASDIDAVAVEVAEVNVAANDLTGRVRCLEAVGFGHDAIAEAAPFDLIFANILKKPLIDLAPDMADHLGAGGYAILSGLLTRQAQDVINAYDAEGVKLRRQDNYGDWITLLLQKPD